MSDEPAARFESTAEQYAVYRPEYDDAALDVPRERFDLDGTGRLLDLGCGTGRLGVALAPHVDEVVGVDPSEAMVEHARERARARVADASNTEWRVGSDADLPAMADELEPLRLTVMGRSFHWLAQERTLDTLHEITEPGGGVALLSDTEWLARGTADWGDAVYEVVAEFLDDPPERTGPIEYEDPWTETLADHGFEAVEQRVFEADREWDADSVVGYLLSLSFCSPAVLGDDWERFENAVRERLTGFDEPYEETATVEVIVAEA
ncbi:MULTISPECIES: methyltransferase domain-containing protein [Halolamina]|uniref:Methyltransferase domain-containing protein n=1 Tax=Halolamina pelagica TaxID=699431 RepID=A0A1I5S122_9EURY|nr:MULTISPECIES: class I SAM-dependent methyltransferase [Halolamina]SFP64449.1 Methyltransferase domain-containing protein [Halolamina pelagica]